MALHTTIPNIGYSLLKKATESFASHNTEKKDTEKHTRKGTHSLGLTGKTKRNTPPESSYDVIMPRFKGATPSAIQRRKRETLS